MSGTTGSLHLPRAATAGDGEVLGGQEEWSPARYPSYWLIEIVYLVLIVRHQPQIGRTRRVIDPGFCPALGIFEFEAVHPDTRHDLTPERPAGLDHLRQSCGLQPGDGDDLSRSAGAVHEVLRVGVVH